MSIGAELGQHFCTNTISKNPKNQWGCVPRNPPPGYASDYF